MTYASLNPICRLLAACATMAVFLLTSSGCASRPPKIKPAPLTVVCTPDGEAKVLGLTLYIIGANSVSDADLINGSIDTALERARRGSITGMKQFTLNNEFTLSERDEIWALWRGAKNADQLVIIADLPKVYVSDENNRRQLVPLDKRRWTKLKKNTLNVTISRDKISLLQSPNATY